jgi:hypothetical protein
MVSRAELVKGAAPEALAAHVADNAAVLRETRHAHGHGAGSGAVPMESVREATYRGHRITIRTTYRIEVDGVPLAGHLAVTNDGRVHYHAMPNLSYGSAVDLVKQLIDAFPDDFGAVPDAAPPAPGARRRSSTGTTRRRRRREP